MDNPATLQHWVHRTKADITVHEKASNGQLKELCRATGNDCGGTSIDARFFKVLQEIAGEKVLFLYVLCLPLCFYACILFMLCGSLKLSYNQVLIDHLLCLINCYIHIYIYIRLKIKPNSVRIRF
jgi:hypothetical protein